MCGGGHKCQSTKQTLNCWEYCLLHLATAVTLMTVTMVGVFLDHIIEMS